MHRIERLQVYLAIYLLVVLESACMGRLVIFGALPDLSCVAVLYFGLFFTPLIGLEVGLVTGLIKDIFCAGFPLFYTVLFALAGFICGTISDKVYRESVFTQCIISFMMALAVTKFRLLDSVYTMLVSPLIFILFDTLFSAREPEEVGFGEEG